MALLRVSVKRRYPETYEAFTGELGINRIREETDTISDFRPRCALRSLIEMEKKLSTSLRERKALTVKAIAPNGSR
jgi:hypothetical protein